METRLQEIASRKVEIKSLIESEEQVDLDALKKELDELEVEEKSINEQIEAETRKAEQEAEERKQVAKQLEEGEVKAKEIEKEEKTMEEKRFTIASPEYRTAWAKKLMGVSLDETDKRALGDALTTTATTFVESDAETQGINNAGLLIPTSLRKDLMELIFKTSPFLRDVRKLEVAGNIDLPYMHDADDANWYAETSCTLNEGIEFKQLQLTGWELAKDVVITWKAEKMTVEGFIDFILAELSMKMGRALANAVIYGDGSNKPVGAIYGLTPVYDADPFQAIKKGKASLGEDAKVGAKAYISEAVSDAIVFKKDANENYPYLAGLPRISNLVVEVDPFLADSDIIVGNPMNYVLNEVEAVSVAKSTDVKCRRTTYGAYAIYDGKPKPNSFAKAIATEQPSV